jgi:hypothetical protein
LDIESNAGVDIICQRGEASSAETGVDHNRDGGSEEVVCVLVQRWEAKKRCIAGVDGRINEERTRRDARFRNNIGEAYNPSP